MSALLVKFPTEMATCFFCLGEFNRRRDDTSRRFCPGCCEEIRRFHESTDDCKKILRESVLAAGGDVTAWDTAMERHFQSISDGTWNPAV